MEPDLIQKFRQVCATQPVLVLPADDGHMESCHQWRQTEVDALTLALATQRPLLVAGEPGSGKTQLARACAVALGWKLHLATLNARSETADLLYQFDAVQRLADAHAQTLQAVEAYWQPQALWQAIDWNGAHGYGLLVRREKLPPPAGHVVLLDEIDKAPTDVPNSLLDVFGERRFSVPGLNITVSGTQNWPLLIATTNREKQLPDAFMRRCIVLNHGAPPHDEYANWLLTYGRAHFGAREQREALLSDDIMLQAAQQLADDRVRAQVARVYAPGLAEYLDLLRALLCIAGGQPTKQEEWLKRLGQYSFRKDTSAQPVLRQQAPEESQRAGS